MKRFVVSVVAGAGLLALGWWGYTYYRGGAAPALEIGAPPKSDGSGKAGGKAPEAGGGRPGPRGPIAVEAGAAQKVALADEIGAVGTLRANETVVVKPEIAGRIVRIGFSDGARVSRNTVLVELDASILAAQVEQTRAELALARTTFDRTDDLAKRNFVSGSARDQAAATLKIQEARLQLAESQLAKTRIVAPFDGVLGLRNVSVGDFVREGADLVTLEDISSMKVDLRLPERYIGQLRRGQRIQLAFDGFPGRTYMATLDALDAQVDANGRALLARGRLANPDGRLRSGMFAKARIVLSEKPTAVVVPEEAILPIGADTFVFRIVDGKAMRTKVVTGIRKDGQVEIVSGVAEGDSVVTAGQLKLQRDGLEVRVIDPRRRGAADAAAPDGAGKGGGKGPGTPDGPGKDGGKGQGAPGPGTPDGPGKDGGPRKAG
jgi:membrane fusion protein (multidrug efflux system)